VFVSRVLTLRLIAPLAAAVVLLAAAPAAQAAPVPARTSASGAPRSLRSAPEPMQFPGDASASAVDAAPGVWLVGARPGAGARAVARAFDAEPIGGGDYVVARDRVRAMAGALRSRGLLLYAQPDALRPTSQAVADDPKSVPPDNWRAAVANPNLAPPPVTPTSPLIALIDTRLDETHPEFAGGNVSTLGDRPLDNLHGTSASSASGPARGRSTSRSAPRP
jgi:hypothetical protein